MSAVEMGEQKKPKECATIITIAWRYMSTMRDVVLILARTSFDDNK